MKLRATMNSTAPAHMRWTVIDDDTYDGAPDASRYSRCMGHGYTYEDAKRDFMIQRLDLLEERNSREVA